MSSVPLRHGLAYRLGRFILLASLFVSLGTSLLIARFSMREGGRRLSAVLAYIPDSYGPIAEEALFIFDLELLDALVRGLAASPDLVWAAVDDGNGLVAESGPRPDPPGRESRIPLSHEINGRMERIGELIVMGDEASIRRDAVKAALVELPLSLGSLAILALLFFAFLSRDIARPLARATAAISDFDPDRAWTPISAERRKGDEIDRLVASFNELGARLVESYDERKRANASLEKSLAEREALSRELLHRTMNNLQTLLSLIYLERGRHEGGPAEEALSALEGRIVSMSIAHRLLYESHDLLSLDLAEFLLRRTLHAAEGRRAGVPKVETVFELSPLRCQVDTALPFGMAAGELLDNVWKHAFPGRARGKLLVRLAASGDSGVRLDIDDDGVGMRGREGIPSGLGLDLVRAIAQDQLRGSFTLGESRLGGLACSIEFSHTLYDRRI